MTDVSFTEPPDEGGETLRSPDRGADGVHATHSPQKKKKMFNSARSSGFAPLLSPLINLNEGNRMNDRLHSGPESLSTAGQRIKPIINKSIRHKIKHFALHLLSEPLYPPPSLSLFLLPAGVVELSEVCCCNETLTALDMWPFPCTQSWLVQDCAGSSGALEVPPPPPTKWYSTPDTSLLKSFTMLSGPRAKTSSSVAQKSS